MSPFYSVAGSEYVDVGLVGTFLNKQEIDPMFIWSWSSIYDDNVTVKSMFCQRRVFGALTTTNRPLGYERVYLPLDKFQKHPFISKRQHFYQK